LSVFIGPVIAYLLWTYRHWLFAALPKDMKVPLVVVCVMSIVLGMGSLKSLHVPTWLSPFDILRPLPGFRSIGVTGRFWGFLALPLSLLGAAALWRFVSEAHLHKHWRIWLGAAFVFQFAFQSETVMSQWLGTSIYKAVPMAGQFRHGPEEVEYVATDESRLQGDVITPTRGVLNCYDMDDFIRADATPGNKIVRAIFGDARTQTDTDVRGRFVNWNHVQVDMQSSQLVANESGSTKRFQVVLNQAFNSSWRANGCDTIRGDSGNLILDCPADRIQQGPIDAVFHNELSSRAASVSLGAWRLWLLLTAGALCALLLTHAEFSLRRAIRLLQ